MSERAIPFASGEYFRRYRDRFPNVDLNTQQLRSDYEDAFRYLHASGYSNPLHNRSPRALQMGSACYATAKTFVDFVHEQNPRTDIFIADLSSYPLQDCKEQALDTKPNVHLIQADTTSLPFKRESFNLIETDGLLQFLPDKKAVLAEWYRILQPGGVVTTRDWLLTDMPSAYDLLLYEERKKSYEKTLGASIYAFTKISLEALLQSVGFTAHLHPVSRVGATKFLHQIVAQKPVSE